MGMLDSQTVKQLAKGAGGGAGAAGILLTLVYFLLGDMRDTIKEGKDEIVALRAEVKDLSGMVHHMRGQHDRMLEYTEWRDGKTEKLSELKDAIGHEQ